MNDFDKLRKLTGEVADLAAAFAVLEWDQQVYMPPGAAADRACQMETLAGELHRRITAPVVGRLLDRIDLQVPVRQLSQEELMSAPSGESSATIRARVVKARTLQIERLHRHHIHCNAQMSPRELHEYCIPDAGCLALLRQAVTRYKLSPRAYDRILKVARTIADLAGEAKIGEAHVFEAIHYRKYED